MSDPPIDYYKVLNIPSDCTDNEIKKAYHRIALQYHPDKSSSIESVQTFQLANEAYQILRDPNSRRDHDLKLRQYSTFMSFTKYSRAAEPVNKPAANPNPSPTSSKTAYSAFGAAGSASAASSAASYAFRGSSFTSGRTTRPQKTRFSGKSDTEETIDLTKDSDSDSDSGSDSGSGSSPKVDNSHSQSTPQTSSHNGPNGPNGPNLRRPRSASNERVSDSKRFHMESLRKAPPLSERHGTTFHFEEMNREVPKFQKHKHKRARMSQNYGYGHYSQPNEKPEQQFASNIARKYIENSSIYMQELVRTYEQLIDGFDGTMVSLHRNLEYTQNLITEISRIIEDSKRSMR